MNIFLIGLVVYLVWFGMGTWYFLHNLGDKYGKEPWYAWPLMLPVLPVAYLIGWITHFNRK
jgi:hypothetical protein